MEYGCTVTFSSLFIVISSIAIVYLSYLTSKQGSSPYTDNKPASVIMHDRLPSSIWCTYGPSKERLCKFRNICYDPTFHEFQFLLNEESIVSGVGDSEAWKNIALSTVLGHNAFYMKISLMRPGNKNLKDYVLLNSSPTFLIHRFKTDNIMHVLHDDLIPLHFTLESMSHSSFNFAQHASLAFVDSYTESFMDKWYKHYSRRNIIFLSQLNYTVCFVDAYGGLLRSTVWFNYGFGKPQGPFLNDHFSVKGIRSFVKHTRIMWSRILPKQEDFKLDVVKVVLIVRNQSRRILNLDVLVEAISRAHRYVYPSHKLQINTIDLAVHNITYALSQISDAKLLIGMHGAGMIMSLYLPPWSSVVEIFPFAIIPNHVSFLKALTFQSEVYPIHYESWENVDRRNSYPSYQDNPLLGKISHLSQQQQNEILTISKVPPVHCCHDPAYLFYMYHDTIISEEIYHTIYRALLKTHKMVQTDYHIFPSVLSFFRCEVADDVLTLHWGNFSNQQEIKRLWFQVTVHYGNVVVVKNETDSLKRMLTLNLSNVHTEVNGWIQPFSDNLGGHIIHSRCSVRSE